MNDKDNSKAIETAFISLPLDALELNTGQIDGLPCNPRNITEAKMEMLKKDIQQYPEMLKLRGLLVYPYGDKYVIIGGNMRYAAMQELGFTTAPCIVIPKSASIEQLKAYTILDNAPFGKWDWDMLANEWEEQQLNDWGVECNFFDKELLEDPFANVEDLNDKTYDKPEKSLLECPHCHHIDSASHFKKVEDNGTVEVNEENEDIS